MSRAPRTEVDVPMAEESDAGAAPSSAVALGPAGDGEDGLSDREVTRLAAGGGLNVAGGFVNQVSLFGLTILIARWLGPSDVGTYSQAFAMRQVLMLVALGGMRSAMTRYVAIHRADDDPAALRGTVRFGLAFTLASASVLGVLLFVLAPWLAHSAFRDPALESALRWVAIGLPSAAFTVAALSATQGFRTQRPNALVGNMLEPALRLVLTLVVLSAGFGLNGSLVVLQVASVVASVCAYVWLRLLMRRHPKVTPRYELREVMRYASISWLSSVAQQGLVWADILILGLFVSPAEVGIYQVATRIVLIGSIVSQALNASLAPRAADLFRRHELSTLSRLYVASSEWLVRLTLPLAVFLFICIQPVLRLFGPEFVSGATVSRILIIGTLIDAATTQGSIVLSMSGHYTMSMVDTVAALVLNVGLNVALIPAFGINGASVAWAAALLLIGTLRAVQVHHYVLGSFPLSRRVFKSVAAGAVALVIGTGVFLALPRAWGFLLVAPLVAAVYFAVLAFLGVDEDDRLVLQELTSRLRPDRALAGRPA